LLVSAPFYSSAIDTPLEHWGRGRAGSASAQHHSRDLYLVQNQGQRLM
jgi:hypothetical protein